MSELRAVYIPRGWPGERLLGPTGKDVHRRIVRAIVKDAGVAPPFFEVPFEEWALLCREFENHWPWIAVGEESRLGWLIAGVPVVARFSEPEQAQVVG